MKKTTFITVAGVLMSLAVCQAEIREKKKEIQVADSARKKNELYSGKVQLGIGPSFFAIQANSVYFNSHNDPFNTLGLSISARYFLTAKTALKINVNGHWNLYGWNNKISQITETMHVASNNNIRGTDVFLCLEHFLKSHGKAKPYVGINGSISDRSVTVEIQETKMIDRRNWGAWENKEIALKGSLFALGTNFGFKVDITSKLDLNLDFGLQLANLHNPSPSNSEIVYTSISYDGHEKIEISAPGINKQNKLTLAKSSMLQLFYNF